MIKHITETNIKGVAGYAKIAVISTCKSSSISQLYFTVAEYGIF